MCRSIRLYTLPALDEQMDRRTELVKQYRALYAMKLLSANDYIVRRVDIFSLVFPWAVELSPLQFLALA